MADAKMTLWGIEAYLNADGKSILDLLTLPSGMDKPTLLNAIMLDGGEFGVVYTDPEFLRSAIGAWGAKYADTIAKWWEVWNIKYNPLYNYDRTELISDSENNVSNLLGRNDRKGNETNQTITESGTDSDDEYKKSSYDESDYSPKDKRTTGIESEAIGTDTRNNLERGTNDETKTDSKNNLHRGRMYGNIGTTRTQEMAIDEDEFRKEYNPYKLITDLFVVDFLICIY